MIVTNHCMAGAMAGMRSSCNSPPNEGGLGYDTAVPALVLRFGRYPFHAGSLGIVRTLGRIGIPVYGVFEDRFSPAATSKYLAGRFIWPNAPGEAGALLADVHAIGARIGKPTVLIPTDDFGAILIAEHAAALRRHFLLPAQPAGLPRRLANRKELYSLCKEHGLACAESSFPDSPRELELLLAHARFPLVVKSIEPWRIPAGAKLLGTRLLHTPEEARAVFAAAEQARQLPVMFQEFIPGKDADWFFHGCVNSAGSCVVSFTGRKYRSYPPYAGPTAYCRSEEKDALRGAAEGLLRAISYRGVMDLDYRLDARDGQFKLLDFNPRVGAQFRVFEDANGVDVVRAMHLDLTGRHVTRAPIKERSFLVEDLDAGAVRAYHRAGETSLGAWFRSVCAASEFGWFARDDVLPFFVMALRRVLSRVVRKLGRGGTRIAGPEPRYRPGRLT